MTDKEKIRKKVKKLHGNPYYMMAVKDVLSIIDSLQEEPVSEDLETFIKERVKNIPIVLRSGFHELCRQLIQDGVEWGKNQAMAEIQVQSMALAHGCPKEPVSEDLEDASNNALDKISKKYDIINIKSCLEMFRLGAEWQKNNLWKDAQGDDLPEIDREVIVSLKGGKVAFAHRPYKGKYIGKSLTTGNIETFENQTFDKGEWNIPNVRYWLDCQIPKIEED